MQDLTPSPPREPLPSNSSVERYTGRWDKQHDTTSGLIQMGFRPYDPTLGRFYAVDPIDGGSLNAYDYAAQDPVNGYDLSGDDDVARKHHGSRYRSDRGGDDRWK